MPCSNLAFQIFTFYYLTQCLLFESNITDSSLIYGFAGNSFEPLFQKAHSDGDSLWLGTLNWQFKFWTTALKTNRIDN